MSYCGDGQDPTTVEHYTLAEAVCECFVRFDGHTMKAADESVILRQSTGLTDTHGQEIFEGDVLQYEGGGTPFVLEWDVQEWDEDGFHTGFHLFYTADQYEIIGNRFENPKLLEDK